MIMDFSYVYIFWQKLYKYAHVKPFKREAKQSIHVYSTGGFGQIVYIYVQGVFLTGTPPKNSKYKKVNLG